MAFVADFNEEELQRALEQANGPAPAVGSGPGAPVAAPAGPAASSAPSGPAPVANTAPGQGTGFINLSNYFSANQAGAEKQAADLMKPLETDGKAAGDAAANAVPEPTQPTPAVYVPPSGYRDAPQQGAPGSADPNAPRGTLKFSTDAANGQAQAGYGIALAKHAADMEKARQDAVNLIAGDNLAAGKAIRNDPTRRNEAMSKDGQNPSAFDSYLTGGAIGGAYDGLRSYYGVTGARSKAPDPTPDPFGGRGPRPGDPGGGRVPAAPPPTTPGAPVDPGWGDAPDRNKKKYRLNYGEG
jgi:hypothetical protein